MAGVSSSISSAAAVHAGSPFKALEAATCPEILGIFQSKNSKFDVDGHQQPQQQPRLPDRILFSCSFNNDRLLNFRG